MNANLPRKGRIPPVLLPSAAPTEWASFVATAKALSRNPLPTALHAAAGVAEHFKFLGESLHRPTGVDVFRATAALTALLACVTEPIPAGEALPTSPIDRGVVDRLVADAAGILSPRLRVPVDSYPGGRDVVHAELFADWSCQSLLNFEPGTAWAVAQYTLGWNPESSAFESTVELDAASLQAFGVPHADGALALAGVVAHGLQEPVLNLAKSREVIKDRPRVGDTLQRLLERCALPITSVRRVFCDDLSSIPGLAARVVRFWQEHPIIHLGGPHYLTAPPRMLVSALGIGHLFKIEAAARTLDGRPTTRVATWIGQRFERLIGLALSELGDRAEVFPGGEYRTDGSELSTDFIVCDRGKPVVTLLEVKKRSLRATPFFGIDPVALNGNLAEFHGPVLQSVRFLASLEDAASRSRLTPAGRAIWDRVEATNKLLLCAVVPSMPVLPAGHHLRRPVDVALNAAIAADERLAGVWARLNKRCDVHWLMLDAEDVCGLVGWKCSTRFGRVLYQYAKRNDAPSVTVSGFMCDVLDFAREKRPGIEMTAPESIVAITDSFLGELSKTYFGRELPPREPRR